MKGKQLLGSVLLAVVLATAYTAIINYDAKSGTEVYLEDVKRDSSLQSYYIAKGKVLEMTNPDMKTVYQRELQSYYSKVFTDDVKAVLDAMPELSVKKDLLTYNTIMNNLVPKVINPKNRQYLKNEVYALGQETAYSPKALRGVNAMGRAWIDKGYIKLTEKEIVNNLAYENPWTMFYLQAQLNEVKNKYSENKKILIIGDSITLGMGVSYKGKQGEAHVENAWWQYIDQSKYDVMFLAVGGMGVIQQGLINNIASDSGFDMLKYAEKNSVMGKEYDKIVIALSTNDHAYSDKEYGAALSEMIEHFKKDYKSKEYILMNFYNHEDEMKRVAQKYSCKFIDVDMNKIAKFNESYDDIHPSAKGQRQIYDLVKDSFK